MRSWRAESTRKALRHVQDAPPGKLLEETLKTSFACITDALHAEQQARLFCDVNMQGITIIISQGLCSRIAALSIILSLRFC